MRDSHISLITYFRWNISGRFSHLEGWLPQELVVSFLLLPLLCWVSPGAQQGNAVISRAPFERFTMITGHRWNRWAFRLDFFSWSGNCHFYGMFKIMAFVELIPTMLHIHPGLTREHQRWACRWMPLGLKESSAQLSGLLAHGHIGKQKDPSDPKKHGHIQKV